MSLLDDDGGITGAVLLPVQAFGPAAYELMGGIKSGRFYLLDRGPMGRFCLACDDRRRSVSSTPALRCLTRQPTASA